jgi:CRP/FNR family transcriptional regulator, cyclic AMP receptor protein
MPLTSDERRELLRSVALFAALDDEELDEVAALAGEREFAPKAMIARQGQVETGFYLIVSGRVQVTHGGEQLATLGPGDFFGELSVIDQQPRLASVVATEPTVCLALASWDLLALLQAKPNIAIALLREITGRVRRVMAAHTH